MTMKLELNNYAKKGIHAYAWPVSIENGNIKRGGFKNGVPVDDYNKVRSKALRANRVTLAVAFSQDQAKWWIDNRNKM